MAIAKIVAMKKIQDKIDKMCEKEFANPEAQMDLQELQAIIICMNSILQIIVGKFININI